MPIFADALKRIAQRMQTCEEWMEMVRDLARPIHSGPKPDGLHQRWAGAADLMAINALEGFVKETALMEEALRRGDRCLLLESDGAIDAFAWVTYRDFKLAPWYTLKLSPGWCYLEYIFVHPAVGRRGVGTYLLAELMAAVRDLGATHMIAGMYATWEASIRLHAKAGFDLHRRLTQCRLLNIFPTPPKAASP
jgi:GNAT superfamily N-acetyltransferase